MRCENYLGGTWTDQVPNRNRSHLGTDAGTNRCARPASVSASSEITAEIFVSRTGFTVAHPDDSSRKIAVYERDESAPKIVTVTANEGERAREQKWMYNDATRPKPVKFKVHWIGYSGGFKTNYAAAGRALMVPGTLKTTETWYKCPNFDGTDCKEFDRYLNLKYADPSQIPFWDQPAKDAYNKYKATGEHTPVLRSHLQQPQLSGPLPGRGGVN